MKYIVLLAFVAILGSLGTALFFMQKNRASDKSSAKKMAFALAMRVTLSILLFVGILLAWRLGYLQPTGITAGQ